MRILWCVWRYSRVCVCACSLADWNPNAFSPCAVREYRCLVYSILLCTLQIGDRSLDDKRGNISGKFTQLLFVLITCGLTREKKTRKTSEDGPAWYCYERFLH